jgi:hypothetical protein
MRDPDMRMIVFLLGYLAVAAVIWWAARSRTGA